MEDTGHDKLKRVKKRVEEMKGFYVHLAVYIVINMFILVNIYLSTSKDGESFWQIGHFATTFFWGLGVVFHATHVFSLNPFLSKGWEEKQIKKYIEKQKKEEEKYR